MPPIYTDEHEPPEVAAAFREEGFRVIEVAKSHRLAARDEMEYLPELRHERGVFVTSDREHVGRLRAGRARHPGIIFLDKNRWDRDAKVALASVMAETIKTAIKTLGSMGMYNIVLEAQANGLYFRELDGKSKLFMSWVRYFGEHLDV